MDLETLHATYRTCRRCQLAEKRQKVVLGEGNPSALLLLVGEGPGAQEDQQGRPFVGRAGQLLDQMLAAAGIDRQAIYITNVVKCRPVGNRTPQAEEIAACLPILRQQFLLIRPPLIVTLGAVATQALIDPAARISRIRGRWFTNKGVRFLPTYHPAYLLRNPASKAAAWEDWQAVAAAYQQVLQARQATERVGVHGTNSD